MPPTVIANPWQALRSLTDARIALGRTGVSLPTMAHLEFQFAHARARDAVHLPLDTEALALQVAASLPAEPPPIVLASAAHDRATYLQRPDLGRQLDAQSRAHLAARSPQAECDLALVVADGLSSLAVSRNAVPFLQALLPALATDGWQRAPITIVTQARVAVGDEVAELLGARCVVVLIGERPGLSSPDSMGLYLTWAPRVGRTDAERNCISNVRPAGLSIEDASARLCYLLREARQRQLSGVDLKDDSADVLESPERSTRNFLLP
jgi:ethanolamine ammonia-lyase small subunit